MLYIIGAMAEFEHELIRDRVIAGIASAKRRGIRFGPPRTAYVNAHKVRELLDQVCPGARSPSNSKSALDRGALAQAGRCARYKDPGRDMHQGHAKQLEKPSSSLR